MQVTLHRLNLNAINFSLTSHQVADSDKSAPGSIVGAEGDIVVVTCDAPLTTDTYKVPAASVVCCGDVWGTLTPAGLYWDFDNCSPGDSTVAEEAGGPSLTIWDTGDCTGSGQSGSGAFLPAADQDCLSADGPGTMLEDGPWDELRFGVWMMGNEDWTDTVSPPQETLVAYALFLPPYFFAQLRYYFKQVPVFACIRCCALSAVELTGRGPPPLWALLQALVRIGIPIAWYVCFSLRLCPMSCWQLTIQHGRFM